MTDPGNAEQVRLIAHAVAKAAVMEFAAEHPEISPKAEIPAPLKWAGAIIAALFTMGIGAMAVWLVSTVNNMQVTLARMDERLASQSNTQDGRYTDLERRVAQLEAMRGSPPAGH